MPRKASPQPKIIYRLTVTLRAFRPPIWRRLEVPGATHLDGLHLMIQAAMGWYNSHLHSFTINRETYGMYDDEFDVDYEDETGYRLDHVVPLEKMKFRYLYDFGDDWDHDIVVEKILPPEAGLVYPRCTAGARACPPEDVGGVWGYAEFLEAIRNPRHEEHASHLEWVGGAFDPEAFDVARADRAVKKYKLMQIEE